MRSGSKMPADEELMRHGTPSAGNEARWQLPEVPGHRTAAMEHTCISDLFLRVRPYQGWVLFLSLWWYAVMTDFDPTLAQ